MATKNYYAILGVSRDETPSGIQAAYRDAVRRTHPDIAGPESATAFQDIVEAHDILSDPERRRVYNQRLACYERERSQPELLHPFTTGWEPPSMFADVESAGPTFEALAERLLRNFTGPGVSERPEALSVEVILTPEEVARGGSLWIGVPVYEVCSACRGSGNDWLFPCLNCGGDGTLSRIQPVQVRIPRSLSLGLTSEASLETFGMNNLFLEIRLRVSSQQSY